MRDSLSIFHQLSEEPSEHIDPAAQLIDELWEKLGMSRSDYYDRLAEELFPGLMGDHMDTVISWSKKGRRIPADRTPDELFKAIGRVVENYVNDRNISGIKQTKVSQNWQNIRDSFKDDLTSYMQAPSMVTDTIYKMLDKRPLVNQLKDTFDALPKNTRFKLYYCFDGWNVMSDNDYLFLYHCQKLANKEKSELLDYLKARRIPAAGLLDCIRDNSTTYLLKMLSTPSTKKSDADIWELFSQKLLEQSGDLTLWRGIIEYFQKNGAIDSMDIDLMILFRHSMSEDEKKDFVSKMHKQLHCRA